MTSNESFFQQRRPAAVLKHGILSRYPTVFATMTGSRSGGRVVYLDGYAGPGRYDDGSPGSPMLAVETAKRVAGWGRRVECVFVERDHDAFADLHRCLTENAPADLRWHAWRGDIADRLDEAMALAGPAPLLAFMDPFGTALAYEAVVGKLLARPASVKTELLLNFNLEMVWRIGGLLAGGEEQGATSSALTHLDRFLGGPWWREVFAAARASGKQAGAARAAQIVAEEYCARVHRSTGFESLAVPVRRRPSHPPLFLLVLFFRHRAAPWKFNDAVSLANKEWRAACREVDLAEEATRRVPGQPSLFGYEMDEEMWQRIAIETEAALEREWVETIAANLVALATEHGSARLGEQVKAVYGNTLGQARESHVRAAWDRAAARGLLAPRDRGRKRLDEACMRLAPRG